MGVRGLWCMRRSAWPTTGSLEARYQSGAASGLANQARRTAIRSRSRRRSSTASCPGSSLTISAASSGITGLSQSWARSTTNDGRARSSR
jgi:hypothetical protein